ncbi:MAG TPA: AMP-binding protein [Ramlibacter sp.]|nr:AMP-binding protein [Ramlibacter sp.]
MLQRDLILPHLVARRALEDPQRVFLQHVDGDELTYAQLHAKALRWAGGLQALGVAAGDTVLVMLPNGMGAVAAWLAASWAGAMEVPINTGYQGRILEYIINNSRARVLVTCREFLPRIEQVAAGLQTLQTVIVIDDAAPASSVLARVLPAATTLENAPPMDSAGPAHHDIATIVYTSGTTGPSKGVMMPWAQCHAMSTGCIPLDDLGPEDAWYVPFPLFHMSGKHALYAAALLGARYVMRAQFSTGNFWPEVRRYRCTTALLIGVTASFIASQPPSPEDRTHPLRNVLLAPLLADMDAFRQRFGLRVATVFNMTEVSCPIMSRFELHGRSCGRLRPGYEVRIVDDHDEEVPVGEAGEIIVRAHEPWVLNAGYFGMPEKTLEAWRNGWFHTGDLGRVDADGYYYYLDRKKDSLRRRGENISSMELEAIICEHPEVLEAAVIGVPSEFGEDEVKACITTSRGRDFDARSLIEFLEPRVPKFMLPRYVEAMDALPRTPTEKVRKDVLRQAGITPHTWDREKAAGTRTRATS